MNINDENFVNSSFYQNFLKENSGKGHLKIRAFAASEALPVPNLHVVVSSNITGEVVTFYDGYTDSSGMIEKLTLPAPKLDSNNMNAPKAVVYEIHVLSTFDVGEKIFYVNMYDGVCVVQNINVIPNGSLGGTNGS